MNGGLAERVEKALDTMRPFLQADGGDVELIDIDGNSVVKIKLLGACESCNMSAMTLQAGIKESILRAAPEIKDVVAI
jgi:Fe-S cluster biogenesis protein NfuA